MRRIEEPFDWDDANVEHLARHGIPPLEAEQLIANEPLVLGVAMRHGELRRTELGETVAGRILTVVTTARGYKIRVVTGWPADRAMRRLWHEQQRR